jgi:RNA polymerase sigma-70 factor (ECF subfamily)
MVLLYRRRHGRQSRLVNNYAKKRPLAAASDPLDWLLRAERRDLVQEALGLLPRRDAEILLLKYTEDWTYRDLAIHLGVTESAVETRLHRARGRLRQVLVGKGAIEVSK